MKVKITRPCRLFLTPDQTDPHTMGDVVEVENLDGIRGLVEVIEEEEKPKKTRKRSASKKDAPTSKRSASKKDAPSPLDGDASNDDGTEDA